MKRPPNRVREEFASARARYLELMEGRPGMFAQDPRLELVLDEDAARRYCEQTGNRLGVVYESPYHLVVVDLVRDPDGNLFAYERLVGASDGEAVAVVPRHQGKFLLLRQFRHALRASALAFPRGYGETGLQAAENARKELGEELRAHVSGMRPLGHVVADSGVSGTRVAVFLCELESFDPHVGHEGIEGAVALTEAELDSAIAAGSIEDGFTLAAWGLLKAQRR